MNKKTVLSILIFALIFVILGLPHTNWGFKTDDFGNLYHCNITSWSEFFKFFYEGNIEAVWHAPNTVIREQAFFCGLFRPLSFVYYLPQFFLFKTCAYGYFLVSIAFHALASVLLFNLLLIITNYSLAFLLALFFGFHPSLYNWLGWTSAQTYFIELVIILSIISLLARYLQTKTNWLYWIALGLYPCTIFLKEASIVLPVWVFVGAYLVARYDNKNFINGVIDALKISSGFWVVACGYLLARLSLFPLTSDTSTLTFEPTIQSFITRMSSRIFDFVTYGVDMLGLSWLPNSTQLPGYSTILKILLTSTIIISLLFMFIKSSQKYLALFLLWSTLLFSWPAILMHYQPRYIYLGLPFFIVLLGVLLKRTKIIMFILGALILSNIFFVHKQLTIRENNLHIITTSFKNLVQNRAIQNRAICFLALPGQWFHEGSTQAMWWFGGDATHPVFQIDLEIMTSGRLDKNYLTITQDRHMFTFTSSNPEKLWFVTPENNHETRVKLVIDQTIAEHNPIYISWDYYKKQFVIL